MDSNTLYVTQRPDELGSTALVAGEVNWLTPPDAFPLRCAAKVRYRQHEQPCRVERTETGQLRVTFDAPQRAVTPGQYVCFYRGDVCLGGALIQATG